MAQSGDATHPAPIALPADLPLFPLGTVLFPGAWLPLHVFEQRYRRMLAHCLDSETRAFVVLLIKEGDEVVERTDPALPSGRPAVPHDLGTVARIVEHRPLPDGRSFVVCRGEQRVRLARLTQEQPYLVGHVQAVPDDAGAVPAALLERADQVRRAAHRLVEAIQDALPPEAERERRRLREFASGLPSEPAALSFAVPQTLGSATAEERQTLLAAPSTLRRLELALPLLFRERQVLDQFRAMGQAGHDTGGDSPFGPIARPSVN